VVGSAGRRLFWGEEKEEVRTALARGDGGGNPVDVINRRGDGFFRGEVFLPGDDVLRRGMPETGGIVVGVLLVVVVSKDSTCRRLAAVVVVSKDSTCRRLAAVVVVSKDSTCRRLADKGSSDCLFSVTSIFSIRADNGLSTRFGLLCSSWAAGILIANDMGGFLLVAAALLW
jgi:hypothetical protein